MTKMNSKFKKDYKRMSGQEYQIGMRLVTDLIAYHHIRYMYWWRSYEKQPTKLKKLILFRYAHKYGLEISRDAQIGAGLYLGHPYNITIGGGAVLGEHVSLHKGCTIGRENRGNREGIPTIGNRVYVGINATVVGNINIGNDVMICPNSFVNFDVPDHSVVIGNPATIHKKEDATYGYL